MTKTIKLKDIKTLIEYKGDFVTPEELAAELKVNGDYEVIMNDEDDTWFGRAMKKLKDK